MLARLPRPRLAVAPPAHREQRFHSRYGVRGVRRRPLRRSGRPPVLLPCVPPARPPSPYIASAVVTPWPGETPGDGAPSHPAGRETAVRRPVTVVRHERSPGLTVPGQHLMHCPPGQGACPEPYRGLVEHRATTASSPASVATRPGLRRGQEREVRRPGGDPGVQVVGQRIGLDDTRTDCGRKHHRGPSSRQAT